VAKKLTYDDDDKQSSENSDSYDKDARVKMNNEGFKIMISEDESMTSSEEPRQMEFK